MQALRSPFVLKPRGGANAWAEGTASVILINEFFGVEEQNPSVTVTHTRTISLARSSVARLTVRGSSTRTLALARSTAARIRIRASNSRTLAPARSSYARITIRADFSHDTEYERTSGGTIGVRSIFTRIIQWASRIFTGTVQSLTPSALKRKLYSRLARRRR